MKRWWTLVVSMALFCCFGVAQESTRSGALTLNSIVDALERTKAGASPQVSYRLIREYNLYGANDKSINSDVVAEVNFQPPANENYRIRNSSGSHQGQQVVQRVLDHEVEITSNGDQTRIALNRDNYDFELIGEASLGGKQCYRLQLRPKRKEKELISGELWVDQHSFFVRQIEGDLAKTPSWWIKKVHVKFTFADFEGTWLQTGMEAVADVRVIGPHTLTSRTLDYRGAEKLASSTPRMRSARFGSM
jgi:hypothetical protein